MPHTCVGKLPQLFAMFGRVRFLAISASAGCCLTAKFGSSSCLFAAKLCLSVQFLTSAFRLFVLAGCPCEIFLALTLSPSKVLRTPSLSLPQVCLPAS